MQKLYHKLTKNLSHFLYLKTNGRDFRNKKVKFWLGVHSWVEVAEKVSDDVSSSVKSAGLNVSFFMNLCSIFGGHGLMHFGLGILNQPVILISSFLTGILLFSKLTVYWGGLLNFSIFTWCIVSKLMSEASNSSARFYWSEVEILRKKLLLFI